MGYSIEYVNGHIEVYDENGAFLFSADNKQERSRNSPPDITYNKSSQIFTCELSCYPKTESA